MQPCTIFSGNLYESLVKWGADRQACRISPHLGVARAKWCWEAHVSNMGHGRGAGAEEGTGASGGSTEEVVVLERIFGTIEPLELG